MPVQNDTGRRNRLGNYLYLKGRIYYYRRRLPKSLTDKGWRSEIRVCLRTAYKKIAAEVALRLHFATTIAIKRWEMGDSNNPDYQHSQTAQLDAFLKTEVERILSKDHKQILDYTEIEARFNSYLSKILAENSQSFSFPPAIEDNDIAGLNLSASEIWEKYASDILSDMNSGINYNDHYEDAVIYSLNENIIDETEISHANIEMFVKQFMVMKIKLYKILAARLNGDFGLESLLVKNTSRQHILSQEQAINNPETSSKKSFRITASKLIERYINTQITDEKWSERTITDHTNRLLPLVEIIGDKNISDISRDDIRDLREILKKLPTRWKEKMVKLGCDLSYLINDTEYEKLSPRSVNIIISAISSMFNWAINEGLTDNNPAKGLQIDHQKAEIDQRISLSVEDIKRIFFDGNYCTDMFKNPAYYWCPLIALYTGMRLEEICQLHCADIQQTDELFVINITESGSDELNYKELKTANAQRTIPIHPYLIDLGLINYKNDIAKSGNKRLFPLLNRTKNTPKYGKQVGKQFGLLLKKKNIGDGKCFHSIRHSFSDFFKKLNLHTDMFREVFGHRIEHLAGRRYGSRFTPKEIYEELISKLNYHEQIS